MIEKHALMYVTACVTLCDAKWICDKVIDRSKTDDPIPTSRQPLIDRARDGLQQLRIAAIHSEMQQIFPELDRVEESIGWLEQPAFTNIETVLQSIRHLIARVKDELAQEHYFHITLQDVQFYAQERPFGPEVADKFETANEDISEAGKCIALQRPTAVIFHLMRVLELGVQRFGKRLQVGIDVRTETWHQIMLHVNKAIEALPSKTAAQRRKKSAFAEASAHLQSVRLAWRNEVMHPKQTYTRDEALTIFNNSRAFMQQLAKII